MCHFRDQDVRKLFIRDSHAGHHCCAPLDVPNIRKVTGPAAEMRKGAIARQAAARRLRPSRWRSLSTATVVASRHSITASAGYVQAELQALIDELHDLKAKMRTSGLLAT